MTRRHVIAGIAGAVLAALGLWLGTASADGGDIEPPAAASTTTTAVPVVAEREVLIGNTLLVPVDLRIVGNATVFEYTLVPLGGPIPVAVPERFELVAADGTTIAGGVSSEEARQVRFENAADVTVAEIAVVRWQQRIYEEYDHEISLTEGATLTDGTVIGIDRILDEALGALVYFVVDEGDHHGFGAAGFTGPLLIASGPGWQDVVDVSRGGSSFATPSLSIKVDPVPDPVPVRVIARPWVPVEDRIVVFRPGA